jgi:aspartyl-tRNA(Asn)/glutamyl-tRNA(Gln) amidotransferase subunit A
MSFDLPYHQSALAQGTSARTLTERSIERAKGAVALNALITDNFAGALAAAEQLSASGPLAGIPFAHKDLFCTQGLRTTAASKMLENFVPPYSAHIVEQLASAGALCIGKSNMDEFAMGSTNAHSYFGACHNPWDVTRVPGGSSGGSAALVAARVVPFASASDTGGSIRQPAAFCGVTGIKPSYGRVSRFGMIAYASSLDQAGVIAQSAADCAQVLQVMAGPDVRDGTALNAAVPQYSNTLAESIHGRRIGVPKSIFGGQFPGMDGAVLAATQTALRELERAGAKLVEIELDDLQAALAAYYIIAPCEASSNLSRFDGVRFGYRTHAPKSLYDLYAKSRAEGFGAEVQKRILLGTYALSAGYFDAYYLRAQKVRRLIAQSYARAFSQVQLIATPTTPTTAYAHSEVQDADAERAGDIFTVAVNLAGLPAISVPAGFVRGLPIGLQLVAPALHEAQLLNVAHQFQLLTDHHRQTPAGFGASR